MSRALSAKATNAPSSLSEGRSPKREPMSACIPSSLTFTRWITPVATSATNTSSRPLVSSSPTRFVASEKNATVEPSREISTPREEPSAG